MTVAPGTRLGHDAIISPLGEGGVGEVWLAEDTTLTRKAALTVVAAAMSPDGRPVTAMEWRDLKSCARAVFITRIQVSLLCR